MFIDVHSHHVHAKVKNVGELKTYPLSNQERNEIVIRGKELKTGIYLYSLVVDGGNDDPSPALVRTFMTSPRTPPHQKGGAFK